MKKRFFNKRLDGSGYIFTCVIVVVMFMFFFLIFEYLHVWVVATDVQKKVSSAVVSVSQDNYENIYACGREGYTGAFLFDGESWNISISPGDVYSKLKVSLGVVQAGNAYVRKAGAATDYTISGLAITAKGSRFRSAGVTSENFEAFTTFSLEIPMSFMGEEMVPLKLKMKSKSNYSTKF